jgi:hypothetical protein
VIQEYLTVARKNHNMAEEEDEIVMDCVKTINTNVPCSFILVGGASMVKRRCDRSTTDVDIIVPASTDMHKLVRLLTETGWFYLKDGVLCRVLNKPRRDKLKRD